MDKTRFSALTKEEKENLTLNDFTVSEIIELINETVLSPENRIIARLRFAKAMTIEAIAEKIKRDVKTVQRRLPAIEIQLNKTILKFL
jgi:hypothetical protein|nr:MAG TPA: ECF sigma factor [Caudoviricetes sp.]